MIDVNIWESATDWLDEVARDGRIASLLLLYIMLTRVTLDKSAPQESWTSEDTVRLAPILAELGVDVLDVSTGGMHPKQHPHAGPGYQAPFAKAVKDKVGDKLIVTSVGSITTGPQANELLEEQGLDAVFCGRTFQKDPGLVWTFAEQLNCEIQLANQESFEFHSRVESKLTLTRSDGASVAVVDTRSRLKARIATCAKESGRVTQVVLPGTESKSTIKYRNIYRDDNEHMSATILRAA